MSKRDVITAIDLGSSKIACLQAELRLDSHGKIVPSIIGVSLTPSSGIKKGTVIDLAASVQDLRKVMHDCELMSNFPIDKVYVGIGGGTFQLLSSHGVVAVGSNGNIQENDLQRALDASKAIVLEQDRKLLQVIPITYGVDHEYGIKNPIGMKGVRLEAKTKIFTMSQLALENVSNCFHELNLPVQELVFGPFAAAESVLSEADKNHGVVLIEIGGGCTQGLIYYAGRFQSAFMIPIGGIHLTQDLAQGLRTSLACAEKLKMTKGSLDLLQSEENIEVDDLLGGAQKILPEHLLSEIMLPRVDEWIQLIHQKLQKDEILDRVSAGVVLSGGGSILKGFSERLEAHLECRVRHAEFQKGFLGLRSAIQSPAFAVGFGLLEWGVRRRTGNQREFSEKNTQTKWSQSLRTWVKDLF